MGAISRMQRNARFIEAFEERIVASLDLKVGMKLTVTAVSLQDEQNESWIGATLVDERGRTHKMQIEQVFDPDLSEVGEVLERLIENYDLEPTVVVEALKDADLFDEQRIDAAAKPYLEDS